MAGYLHGHGDAVLQAYRVRTAQNSAPHLLPALRPGTTLLDVGCGEGGITRGLAAAVSPGRTVGLDSSQEVVAKAVAAGPVPDNLAFEVGDVLALPFADASFDVVHAHQLLHHLSDPPAALREMARVARPGGIVSCREGDYEAAYWYPRCEGWEVWQRVYLAVSRHEGGTLAGRRLPTWAHEAGLDDAVLSASAWSYPGFDTVASVAASWGQRMTEARFVGLALQIGVADRAALERAASQIAQWALVPGAMLVMAQTQLIITV